MEYISLKNIIQSYDDAVNYVNRFTNLDEQQKQDYLKVLLDSLGIDS